MTNQTPAIVADVEPEIVTLAADIAPAAADAEITSAVRGRCGLARKYVKWIRRRHPDATPAEVVALLERHYVMAISGAGAAIAVGAIAAEVTVAMIPVVGPAAAGTKAVAKDASKQAAKEATKAAVKSLALGAAGAVSRPFRSIDLDGDGIADEAQAITLAKGVGSAIAGRAGAVGGFVASTAKKVRMGHKEADS